MTQRKCRTYKCIVNLVTHNVGTKRCCEYCMMSSCNKIISSSFSGSMDTKKITCPTKRHRFIEHHPVFYTISKFFSANSHIITEPVDDFTVSPATFLFESLWKIPVIQRDPW